ncbi:hypothetical protein BDD43_2671 [Mucilaginibacter gracilis]|uniref:Uncharacterized protein n=1 Tax=Mucilaginibacter gracilis TaxID=423350 RepID=A0A495J2A4_9SPHI|nr:hypothetical protein [Mucilaginibacter gracilis]RKR82488.1 hypothetical protein BDD43_2671 [Mucilaginibacter gracilis]
MESNTIEKLDFKYTAMKNLGALFAFLFLLTALVWSVVTNIV